MPVCPKVRRRIRPLFPRFAAISSVSLPGILSNIASKVLLEAFLLMDDTWKKIVKTANGKPPASPYEIPSEKITLDGVGEKSIEYPTCWRADLDSFVSGIGRHRRMHGSLLHFF